MFRLMAVVVAGLASASVSGDVFTIGEVTFDTDNTAQTAAFVEGSVSIKDHSSAVFARIEQSRSGVPGDAVNPFITFDKGKSVGRLLGRESRHANDRARFVSFPEKGVPGPQPNKDRVSIELTWGKHGVKNEDGPDFVVYEVGTFEAFVVSVRKVGSPDWTFYRYQFPYRNDATHGVNSVVFDLSSFGVAAGEVVDAIRIRNVFNYEAPAGADKVDGATGEGRVVYPTDVDYPTAHKLLSSPTGDEFRTEFLDADIIYVAALHKIVPLGAAARPAAGTGSSN